ncbi:MAG TPA: Type 1 glutamine amidotransferase-like domain-containing protein [Ktedonobacterales bacterium]
MAERRRDVEGAIALVGSGEYTDAMLETDESLLATVGGSKASVVLLPTAAGLEENGPSHWNTLGLGHFRKLGVTDIRPSLILDHASACDPRQVELLRGADFFYFSGGNPPHVTESLRGTPAWEVISQAQRSGAVVAGCSAGAMAMSGYSLPFRALISGLVTGAPGEWTPALGTVPNVVVFPHFDRLPGGLSEPTLRRLSHAAPDGVALVGVDEDTALARLDPPGPTGGLWRVMGRQSVHIYRREAKPLRLRAGETVTL